MNLGFRKLAQPRSAHVALRLIAYDVQNDRCRTRIAKVLDGVGDRIQWSVFEADLDDAALVAVLQRLEPFVDPETDRVRVYTLCGVCAGHVLALGRADVVEPGNILLV